MAKYENKKKTVVFNFDNGGRNAFFICFFFCFVFFVRMDCCIFFQNSRNKAFSLNIDSSLVWPYTKVDNLCTKNERTF